MRIITVPDHHHVSGVRINFQSVNVLLGKADRIVDIPVTNIALMKASSAKRSNRGASSKFVRNITPTPMLYSYVYNTYRDY